MVTGNRKATQPDRSKSHDKSTERLEEYFFSKGWFNVKASNSIQKDTTKAKRATVTYTVQRSQPYFLDSITTNISSPAVDSLFRQSRDQSFLVVGKQYDVDDFINERDRLTIQFRNSGLYHFTSSYMVF